MYMFLNNMIPILQITSVFLFNSFDLLGRNFFNLSHDTYISPAAYLFNTLIHKILKTLIENYRIFIYNFQNFKDSQL